MFHVHPVIRSLSSDVMPGRRRRPAAHRNRSKSRRSKSRSPRRSKSRSKSRTELRSKSTTCLRRKRSDSNPTEEVAPASEPVFRLIDLPHLERDLPTPSQISEPDVRLPTDESKSSGSSDEAEANATEQIRRERLLKEFEERKK